MREEIDRLLRDLTLTTLAFAIALGWSLFKVAEGFGYLLVVATHSAENAPEGPLSFTVRGHSFYFDPLVTGLVELAVVVAVILLVRRYIRSAKNRSATA